MITLTLVKSDVGLGTRVWMAVLAAAGVAVVILSWTVPEPEPSNPNPTRRVEPVTLAQCAQQAPPALNYGARTMDYTTCLH